MPQEVTPIRSAAQLSLREDEIKERLNELDREHRGQPFPQQVRDEWNFLNNERDEIKRTQAEQRVREQRLREIVVSGDDRYMEHTTPEPRRDDVSVGSRSIRRSAGLRAIDKHRDQLSPAAGDRLDAHVRSGDPIGLDGAYLDAVGADEYLSAFTKMVADPQSGHLRFSPHEVDAVRRVSQVESERALSVGTGSAGGFAIPFALDPSIILANSGVLNPFRAVSRVETVPVGEWRGVASDGVVASYQAEAAEMSDASPVLVQPTIVAKRGSAFVPFSVEVGQDWGNLVAELSRLIGDARDVVDATKMLTGTGTNEPGGVLNIGGTGGLTTTQRVLTAGVATFAVGDSWLLKGQMPPRFIPGASVLAAPKTFDTIYRFTGGNATEPPIIFDRQAGPCFGVPKYELSTMVSTTTTGSRIMLAGDFKTGFTITDVLGMNLEIIPHLFGAANRFPTGQRGVVCWWRTGSGVTAANALRCLEVQ
jgi:HK97 family phage major capsid protein